MVELFLLLSRNGVTYRRVVQLNAINALQVDALLVAFKQAAGGDGLVSLNFSDRIEGIDMMLHSKFGNLGNIIDV